MDLVLLPTLDTGLWILFRWDDRDVKSETVYVRRAKCYVQDRTGKHENVAYIYLYATKSVRTRYKDTREGVAVERMELIRQDRWRRKKAHALLFDIAVSSGDRIRVWISTELSLRLLFYKYSIKEKTAFIQQLLELF
jgi:hypothetical protein